MGAVSSRPAVLHRVTGGASDVSGSFPLMYYVISNVAHYPAPLAWLILLLAGHEVGSRVSRAGYPSRRAGA